MSDRTNKTTTPPDRREIDGSPLPTVKSLGDWSVGGYLGDEAEVRFILKAEVRFILKDKDEARAWLVWLLDQENANADT